MKKIVLDDYLNSPPRDGYIPAPYQLEEGENIDDFYLEPVLFHNPGGPTIGVTTCGVIVKDGLFFKDMDNDGVLSPYEDWRNDDETRARDMVAHLTLNQQAGLVLNTLWNTPISFTREGAKDENGNIVPGKIFKRYDPEEPEPTSPLPGISMRCDDSDVLEKKGFITIQQSPADARAMYICPAKRAEEYFQKEFSAHQKELKYLFEVYTEEELEQLFQLLMRLYAGIENLQRSITVEKEKEK